MRGALIVQLLGPLEVRRDGELIDLGGPQPRLVLARLLVADGRVVPTGALLDALWGERVPESASGTLQSYVSRLRKALGPDGAQLLRFQSGGYLLEVGSAQVDARRFVELAGEGSARLAAGRYEEAARLLRDAEALWRGDALADIDAEFARTAAIGWDERRLTVAEDRYEAELRAGRASTVVAGLAEAVAAAPLRERLRGLLALALYQSGRQADALAVLDEGRRLLADELGLEMSRELRALQASILGQDAALEPPQAPPTSPLALADPPRAFASGDLIGRTAELRVVRSALREALAGTGARTLVVEGEPGIGKTRLTQELVRQAEASGALTLAAGTLETGAAPVYGPWLQVFRLAQRWPAALPEAADDLAARAAQPLGGTSAVAAAVADSVAEIARSLAAEQGLVLVIEDLQWADPASLDLLTAIGPRLYSAPVVIAVTVRDLELGRDDAVVEALAQLTRQAGTRRIRLRGLTRRESGELLGQITGTAVAAEVVAAVHERSEGNPFFTTELGRLIAEPGSLEAGAVVVDVVPSSVRDVLQRRVGRLPEPTRRLMEVAAVLGRETHVALLARVADRSLDDCLDDLEHALVHRLLEVPPTAPGSVRFAHALVRETLAEGMSSLRRARLHLRAADGIIESIGQNDDTQEIIAEHLWSAAAVGASGRAATALEAAAQVALKRQALVSAESLLHRAASLYRSAGTENGLAELRVLRQLAFVRAARYGYAVNAGSDLVRRARELVMETDRRDILLDVLWADWAASDTGGQPVRSRHLVAEAEELVRGVEDNLLRGCVDSMRAFSERHFGNMASAREHIERSVREFDEVPPALEAGFYLNGYLTSLGYRHWVRTLTEGLDREAIEQDYLTHDLPFARGVFSLFGSAATMAANDHAGLRLYAERGLDADPERVLSFWSASAEMYMGIALLQQGDIGTGLDRLQSGRTHMAQAGGRTMIAGILAAATQALAHAGELDEARGTLRLARTELAEGGELAYRPFVELAAAQLARISGDNEAATNYFDLAARLAAEQGSLGVAERIVRERATAEQPQSAG
jgi:DNA-binding SARP family transcriptional activator